MRIRLFLCLTNKPTEYFFPAGRFLTGTERKSKTYRFPDGYEADTRQNTDIATDDYQVMVKVLSYIQFADSGSFESLFPDQFEKLRAIHSEVSISDDSPYGGAEGAVLMAAIAFSKPVHWEECLVKATAKEDTQGRRISNRGKATKSGSGGGAASKNPDAPGKQVAGVLAEASKAYNKSSQPLSLLIEKLKDVQSNLAKTKKGHPYVGRPRFEVKKNDSSNIAYNWSDGWTAMAKALVAAGDKSVSYLVLALCAGEKRTRVSYIFCIVFSFSDFPIQ